MEKEDFDELLDATTAYYLGNYQRCLTETQKLKPSLEKDILTYKAYIAQGKYGIALDEINTSSPKELQELRYLADYLSSEDRREIVKNQLREIISGSSDVSNVFFLVAARIFTYEADYEMALQVLRRGQSLEGSALNLQILLLIHRVDLAKKELQAMSKEDDDNVLTHLSTAWVNLAQGGEKPLSDAYYAFQEMVDKYGSTTLLLSGLAVVHLAKGNLQEAESVLQEAMEKDNNCADVLVNMICLSQYLGKPSEVTNRYISQLKDSHRFHPFVKDYLKKTEEFDNLCDAFGTPDISCLS